MEFHNRATGMIHSVLHSPDGGEVHGTHKTLEESQAWAKSGASPVDRSDTKTVHTSIHRTESGHLLGVVQSRNYGAEYIHAVR
jgi:hypothetical protein